MKILFSVCALCLSLLASGVAFAAMDHKTLPGAMPAASNADMSAHAAMDHQSTAQSASYSDQAFLSGMIAHHEGAIAMVKELARTPKIDPQVKAWADGIEKAQHAEIAQMKGMLVPLGGVDKTAYAHMQTSMTAMLQAQRHNSNPALAFVEQMTPHHAGALEMSIPALLHSRDPQIVKLAKDIILSQTKEIAAFRTWMRTHTNY